MTDILGKHPTKYYTKEKALLYERSGAFKRIQTKMALEAIEIANFTGKKILDIGCGTGFSTIILVEKGFKTSGCDISKNMLTLAKKKEIKNLKLCSVTKLDFKTNEFDGIISISTLQWLKPQEYEMALEEMARVLKSKGIIVIQFYPKIKEELDYFLLKAKKKFKIELIESGIGRKKKSYIRLKKRK